MFNINFQDIINKVLPLNKRTIINTSGLFSIIKPLKQANDSFVTWKDDLDYQLKFTGQVIYLEHLLNDIFDSINRGITIVDGALLSKIYYHNRIESRSPKYLYNRSEAKPPIYFKNKTEYLNQINFIIQVPTGVVFTELYMRSIVDKYKQAGVNYVIEII